MDEQKAFKVEKRSEGLGLAVQGRSSISTGWEGQKGTQVVEKTLRKAMGSLWPTARKVFL